MEVALQTMGAYPPTLELARWAETQGLAGLAVADHYLASDADSSGFDQLVIMGGIARETTRLELCTLVSPLTFRHPAVHLKAAVTLDQMSGGRFSLGVGAGWMELEHELFGLDLPPLAERFDRLAETLAYLRAALSGRAHGFEGRYYRLGPFTPQPVPHSLRLIVGGQGPRRTPDLAGSHADEYNVFPAESGWTGRIERARSAARQAGRDPDRLLLSTTFPPLVGRTENEVESRLAAHAERFDTTPEETRHALERLGIPFGTPDRLRRAVTELGEAGITRIYLQVGTMDLDQIEPAVGIFRELAG